MTLDEAKEILKDYISFKVDGKNTNVNRIYFLAQNILKSTDVLVLYNYMDKKLVDRINRYKKLKTLRIQGNKEWDFYLYGCLLNAVRLLECYTYENSEVILLKEEYFQKIIPINDRIKWMAIHITGSNFYFKPERGTFYCEQR